VGLVGAVGAFYAVQPIQRSHGFVPPAYPRPSLADPPVLRAVVGTAVVLALLAVFGLAVGAIMRRTAGALIVVLPLLLVAPLVADALSPSTGSWIRRLTPSAGLAIQQTRERFDTVIGPWQGFGVLCAYTAVALALAGWLLRRRDA
jgi:ribose/xylose/arabinose/galactoside ABC-type transport system permease subunit